MRSGRKIQRQRNKKGVSPNDGAKNLELQTRNEETKDMDGATYHT